MTQYEVLWRSLVFSSTNQCSHSQPWWSTAFQLATDEGRGALAKGSAWSCQPLGLFGLWLLQFVSRFTPLPWISIVAAWFAWLQTGFWCQPNRQFKFLVPAKGFEPLIKSKFLNSWGCCKQKYFKIITFDKKSKSFLTDGLRTEPRGPPRHNGTGKTLLLEPVTLIGFSQVECHRQDRAPGASHADWLQPGGMSRLMLGGTCLLLVFFFAVWTYDGPNFIFFRS